MFWERKSTVAPALAMSRAVSPCAPELKEIVAPPPPPVPPLAVIVEFPAWAPLMNATEAPVPSGTVPPWSVIVALLTVEVELNVIAAPAHG
jgi:hypothetical protein